MYDEVGGLQKSRREEKGMEREIRRWKRVKEELFFANDDEENVESYEKERCSLESTG